MAVCFEIDANVIACCGVVQVLYARWGADYRELEVVCDIVGSSTVGVGSLDNADCELFSETSCSSEVPKERSCESCDAVSVQ